jgi:hypothetical protein
MAPSNANASPLAFTVDESYLGTLEATLPHTREGGLSSIAENPREVQNMYGGEANQRVVTEPEEILPPGGQVAGHPQQRHNSVSIGLQMRSPRDLRQEQQALNSKLLQKMSQNRLQLDMKTAFNVNSGLAL